MSRLKINRIKKPFAFSIMALLGAFGAMAAEWNGSEDNDWFNANNWDGGVLPTELTAANLKNGGTIVIKDGTASAGSMVNTIGSTIRVEGSSAESKGILSIPSAGDQFASYGGTVEDPNLIHIKENGVFEMMSAGVSGSKYRTQLLIQHGAGSTKLVIDKGGELNMYYSTSTLYDKRGLLAVGSGGHCEADISGTVKVTNIKIGLGAGSDGNMVVRDGASVTAGYLLQIGVMGGNATTEGGKGYLKIEGGSVTGGEISVGALGLSSGSSGDSGLNVAVGKLDISGGTLTATTRTYIGESGIGTVNVSGGTANFKALVMGKTKSHTTIAPEGTLNITGGDVTATTAAIGSGANTSGTVNLSGGTFASSSALTIGSSGKGEFIISGTGVLTADSIRIGYLSTGEGLLELQSATGSIYKNGGTTLTAISGGTSGKGTVRFNYAGSMTFANIMSGNNLRVEHVNSGVTTLSGASTYAGGTLLSKGTIIAANNTALGTGKLEVKGGSLKTSVSALSVNSIEMTSGSINLVDGLITQTSLSGDFSMAGGTLAIDIESLSSFDQILSAGGMALLDGGILNVNGYEGFEGVVGQEGYRYKIFEGFSPIADHSLAITGYDKSNWIADIDSEGYLYFVAIPEPAAYAALFGALALAFAAYRKRR